MPLLRLLDLGYPPLAVLVGRSVYQLDDTDDPGLPEHDATDLMQRTCAVGNSNQSTHTPGAYTACDQCYMIDIDAMAVCLQTDGDGRHGCPRL